MKVKTKIKLHFLIWFIRKNNANRLAKKIEKNDNRNRYPLEWRNNYVLKKAKKLSKLLKFNLIVKGFENLPKNNFILTPNHASVLDPVLILLSLENKTSQKGENYKPVFLAKKELLKNRTFKGYVSIMNTFFVDRNNPRQALETLNKMADYAKENKKIMVIFPEGTRSTDDSLNNFKNGAFYIAKKHFLSVVPVTINNSSSISMSKWNRKSKVDVEVIFHPAIKPINLMTMNTSDISLIVQKKIQSVWKPSLVKEKSEEEGKW